MKQLKHRNIVEFYEDFNEGGDTYLVMELCEGGSIRSYVKEKGPLDEQSAVYVLRQLISAVTYMHRYNVLHRDLSAGNVFIKDASKMKLNVKLGDFGLATNLSRGETACTIVGTPGYIAPQVYHQDYDQAADVYSLGGVLYTMLTARDPPARGTPSTHGMSTMAVELVEAMMHTDAVRRIKLKEIVMTDFMRENTDDEARLYSRESSRDGRRRSREPRYPSRDGRSQDRRPPLRSSSQPVNSARMPMPSSQTNRPVHDRLPSTSTRPMPTPLPSGERDRHHNNMWPIRMERLAGQRIRTQGGRYVAELNTRCRFEVATRGDIITRILITEYDPYRRIQTVFVHRIAERKERGREEGDDLIELTRNPMVYTA
uniref:Protein kinase domain-containing protein n=1 Tax=Caenorhabditis japonica TaxID=281687 RepID=A0A8R1HZV1_CAEJA